MMFNYLAMLMLMCLGTGARGGTDLLNVMTSDSYWEAKHQMVSVEPLERDAGAAESPKDLEAAVKDLESPEYKVRNGARKRIEAMGPAALPMLRTEAQSSDPEAKTAAAELVHALETHGKERDIRRLMAIRTLGERKEAGAVAILETLTQSKELFVPEYAKRALAQIQGKAYVGVDHQAALIGDLQLLTDHAAVVAQSGGVLMKAITIDSIVDEALANPNPMMGMMGQGAKRPEKKEMVERGVQQLLSILERIGDVRLDGVTVEVGDDLGAVGGSAVVLVRGEYDREAMVSAVNAAMGAAHEEGRWSTEGKVEVLSSGNVTALLPSNELVAIVVGAPENVVAARKVAMLGAFSSGKGTLGNDKAMSALLAKVDPHGTVWAVARLNEAMRGATMVSGFDTIVLTSTKKDDGLTFSFSGEGSDAAKVKASVDEVNSEIGTALTQLQAMGDGMKALQPVLELYQSLKVQSNGTTAGMTGTFKPGILTAAAASMLPMMELAASAEEVPATQP